MYNSRRKPLDLPQELTAVWSCTSDECKGWMRDNFVFAHLPVCPQCQAGMVKSERLLYVVANTSPLQNKH